MSKLVDEWWANKYPGSPIKSSSKEKPNVFHDELIELIDYLADKIENAD